MELTLIQEKVFTLRGNKVILDYDLAIMYGVETKVLKQAVKRNPDRFPEDFMFELTHEEMKNLRSQNVTSNWGGNRYLPFAFTEQGVAMLSSVLKSKKALQVNITIMRAFVMMRQYYLDSEELKKKVEKLETEMHMKFDDIQQALNYLLDPPMIDRNAIGFKQNAE
ncbi:ORF6N domain-containing protein [Dyadobacter sp. CY323]|uniref:ORF6N domain-containing protein n=1 Tax=Dyadobacter sp. CY323 TaxID=2907302 RepID=UPI001F1A526E|nr:ORF6N domain-containing protein [Dyadobacter sp. CY323]MCE6992732.1 ORF6N domain-containing protein [Dyadobacter sp. CY323]